MHPLRVFLSLLLVPLGLSHHFARADSSSICTSKVCEYHFTVRWARTMVWRSPDGRKAFNVEANGRKLQLTGNSFHVDDEELGSVVDKDSVYTADGYGRNIITVNDQFPGPTIEVMHGAQVVVHVTNKMWTQATSIHWHGMSQKFTPWMDGVPYVSQCPIDPRQTFTYRFVADPPGTHWWHSHFRSQRLDGLFGMLIVHKHFPDLPYTNLMVHDWHHMEAHTHETMNPFPIEVDHAGTGDLMVHATKREFSVDGVEIGAHSFVSGLVNGRGRWNGVKTPLDYTVVKYGHRHLFHMVNSGGDFGFEVSIDGHDLIVRSSDGCDFHSIKVQSIIVYPGESFDFEIDTYAKADKYWVRSLSLRHGDAHEVKAVLAYEGHEDDKVDPITEPRECTADNLCYVFNCPYAGYAGNHYKRCISMADARSTDISTSYSHGVFDDRVEEYFFNFGFSNGPSINSIRFVSPKVPLFQKYTSFDIEECDPEKCRERCSCTHMVSLPYNRTMQFVLTNYHPKRPRAISHHPVHLHGHTFAVMKMGYPDHDRNSGLKTVNNPDISCVGELCSQQRWNHRPRLNYKNPPIKDTVVVPAGGYTVIRFRTDNPGYWLFHCHMDSHANTGMTMLFSEAVSRIPHPPRSMPTCRHFYWSEDEFNTYINSQMKFDDYINSRYYGFRGFSGAFAAEEEKHKKENEAAGKANEEDHNKKDATAEGKGDQDTTQKEEDNGSHGHEEAEHGKKEGGHGHEAGSGDGAGTGRADGGGAGHGGADGGGADHGGADGAGTEGKGGDSAAANSAGTGDGHESAGEGEVEGEIGFEGQHPGPSDGEETSNPGGTNHELDSESGAGAEGESMGQGGQEPSGQPSGGDSPDHSEAEVEPSHTDNEPSVSQGGAKEHKGENVGVVSPEAERNTTPQDQGDGVAGGSEDNSVSEGGIEAVEGAGEGNSAPEPEGEAEVTPVEDNEPQPDHKDKDKTKGHESQHGQDNNGGNEATNQDRHSGDGHHPSKNEHGSGGPGPQEDDHRDSVILYCLARQLKEHGERGDNYIIAYDTRRDMLAIYHYSGDVSKLDRDSGDYEKTRKTSFPIYTVKLEYHYWSPHDLYVGSHIDFDHRKYVIADCNSKTFDYMEKHPEKYPKSDVQSILSKIQKYAADKKEEIRRTDPTRGMGTLTFEDFKKQVLKMAAGHMVEHEIITLARHYKVSERQERYNAYGPPKFYKFLYGSNGQVNYREFVRRLNRHGYGTSRRRQSQKENTGRGSRPVPAGSVDYQSLVRDLFS